jgi:hypothetical protein
LTKPILRCALLVAVLAAAFIHPAPTEAAPAAKSAASALATVAIIDSGINPYHITFRDNSPRARKHPSTYIPGYPKNAIALKLSLNEKKYWDAVKKDCKQVWSKIKPGRLYWVPGTKIVGAITFSPQDVINCDEPKPAAGGRILDDGGHGTMTASRATSVEYGACKECSVVAVQFSLNGLNSQDAIDSITWAADNASWIDAQSNSWGPLAPVWDPTGAGQLVGATPELVRTVEETARKHLAFWASGNGALFRWGALGHPTLLAPHMTASTVMVGGHDSGYVATWPGFPPHVVSDACASWAAHHTEIEKSEEDVGGGTSAATPFAAGGAARILLEARKLLGDRNTGVDKDVVASGKKGLVAKGPLADGKFTLEEWRRVLFATASKRPGAQREDGPPCGVEWTPYNPTPIKWSDVPDGYPEYIHIGYGAVDKPALDLAFAVLSGQKELPNRSETDSYFEKDRAAREALYEVWSKP